MAKQKKVAVLARIQWNHEDRVCYQVRSNKALKDTEYKLHRHGIVEINGIEYSSVVRDGERYAVYVVCLINGIVEGCNCPSFSGKCYHKEQIQIIENTRRTPKEVEAVEEPVQVAPIATPVIAERETDGLDPTLLSTWKTRESRAKAVQAEYVRGFNVKLQALKEDAQLDEAS